MLQYVTIYNMKYTELSQKFEAAQKILSETTTTPEKIRTLGNLLKGIHPKIDAAYKEINKTLSTLEKIDKSQVIELTAEALPETTPEEKRRKKALLLLLRWWNELKNEVSRVEKEMRTQEGKINLKTTNYGNILSLAKGPLGVITLIAVGVVILKSTAVEINIKNDGCAPLEPISQFPNFIPGLKLPSDPIPSGASAVASLPPLTLTIDNTVPQKLRLHGYKLEYSFDLKSSGINILYNGQSLMDKLTEVKLTKDTPQEILIRCL